MWVRFLADYDYRLPQATIAYLAGMVLNVPSAHADAAVAAGRAVRLKTPRKGEVADAET